MAKAETKQVKCKHCPKTSRVQAIARHEPACIHGPAFTPHIKVVNEGKKDEKFICQLCDAEHRTRVYALKHLAGDHAISGLSNDGKLRRRKLPPEQGKGTKKTATKKKKKKNTDATPLPMPVKVTGGPNSGDDGVIRKQVIIEIVLDVKTR